MNLAKVYEKNKIIIPDIKEPSYMINMLLTSDHEIILLYSSGEYEFRSFTSNESKLLKSGKIPISNRIIIMLLLDENHFVYSNYEEQILCAENFREGRPNIKFQTMRVRPKAIPLIDGIKREEKDDFFQQKFHTIKDSGSLLVFSNIPGKPKENIPSSTDCYFFNEESCPEPFWKSEIKCFCLYGEFFDVGSGEIILYFKFLVKNEFRFCQLNCKKQVCQKHDFKINLPYENTETPISQMGTKIMENQKTMITFITMSEKGAHLIMIDFESKAVELIKEINLNGASIIRSIPFFNKPKLFITIFKLLKEDTNFTQVYEVFDLIENKCIQTIEICDMYENMIVVNENGTFAIAVKDGTKTNAGVKITMYRLLKSDILATYLLETSQIGENYGPNNIQAIVECLTKD